MPRRLIGWFIASFAVLVIPPATVAQMTKRSEAAKGAPLEGAYVAAHAAGRMNTTP